MYVVAATAVLPYSDDGASGEGLFVSCEATESGAVTRAVEFMDYFRKRMYSASPPYDDFKIRLAEELCTTATQLESFHELGEWFRRFYDNMNAYALENEQYGNPNHVLNLVIKEVDADAPVLECFSSSAMTL